MSGRIAKLTNLKNGTVSITGLTHADLRTIANAVQAGAFEGGDRGGPVSDAVYRFGGHLRTLVMFPGRVGSHQVTCSRVEAGDLYREVLADGRVDYS